MFTVWLVNEITKNGAYYHDIPSCFGENEMKQQNATIGKSKGKQLVILLGVHVHRTLEVSFDL